MPRDRNGREVNVGDRVRIVALGDKFINGLPVDERARLKSMIGEVFEVYAINSMISPGLRSFVTAVMIAYYPIASRSLPKKWNG
jgi:hypothetical protein